MTGTFPVMTDTRSIGIPLKKPSYLLDKAITLERKVMIKDCLVNKNTVYDVRHLTTRQLEMLLAKLLSTKTDPRLTLKINKRETRVHDKK